MRIDLQDLYRANPKAFLALSAVIAAAFALLVVKGVSSTGSSPTKGKPAPRATSTSTGTTAVVSNGVTTPNPDYHPAYASNVPSSPADQKFASEVGASGTEVAAIESVTAAPPAWTRAYPEIPAADTRSDQTYVTAFLTELLDRTYRKQPRLDLARWVSAESANEMLPGEPAEAGGKALYAELLDPGVLRESSDPVPSTSTWTADAAHRVTQHVYGIFVSPNEQWASLVSSGFTSRDPLLTIDDATGMLATTTNGRTLTQHFSVEVMVASALHHPGYGAATIDQWQVG